MKVIVTGATGFIGEPLTVRLREAGHHVTALSRDAARAQTLLGPEVTCLTWNQEGANDWKQAVGESDVVIHLAGESVGAQKWTPAFKEKLRASRVETTRALVAAMRDASRKPEALVCSSAVGYYGSRGDEILTEESTPGDDFLANVCKEWEAAAEEAETFGVRVARMRVSLAMGQGGALERMLYPFRSLPISPWKLGLGGPLGNGRQWMAWIHQSDAVGLFLWAASQTEVRGAVNVASPNPVTNAQFSRALGRALHRPAIFPLPAFLLRLIVGEFSDALLCSQRVLPTVAEKQGYTFQYPDVTEALKAALAT